MMAEESSEEFSDILRRWVRESRLAIEQQYGLVPADALTYNGLLILVTACVLNKQLLPRLVCAVRKRAQMMGLAVEEHEET
jgi:hypothetical protein